MRKERIPNQLKVVTQNDGELPEEEDEKLECRWEGKASLEVLMHQPAKALNSIYLPCIAVVVQSSPVRDEVSMDGQYVAPPNAAAMVAYPSTCVSCLLFKVFLLVNHRYCAVSQVAYILNSFQNPTTLVKAHLQVHHFPLLLQKIR